MNLGKISIIIENAFIWARLMDFIVKEIEKMSKQMTALIIMDGFGINPNHEGNAIYLAGTPHLDALMANPTKEEAQTQNPTEARVAKSRQSAPSSASSSNPARASGGPISGWKPASASGIRSN